MRPVYQATFDLVDPVIYPEQIRDVPPFAGNDPKELLLLEAIGDAQVPNITSEMMARSYGMEMAGPAVYEVFGVPKTEPIDSLAFGRHPKPAAPPQGEHSRARRQRRPRGLS